MNKEYNVLDEEIKELYAKAKCLKYEDTNLQFDYRINHKKICKILNYLKKINFLSTLLLICFKLLNVYNLMPIYILIPSFLQIFFTVLLHSILIINTNIKRSGIAECYKIITEIIDEKNRKLIKLKTDKNDKYISNNVNNNDENINIKNNEIINKKLDEYINKLEDMNKNDEEKIKYKVKYK